MQNRRNFLKITGVSLAGSLIKPIQSKANLLDTRKRKFLVGLLLPKSVEYPNLPVSFLNGIQQGIKLQNQSQNTDVELVVESVNFGTPSITIEKTRKLIEKTKVNLIVGLLNPKVSAHVGELLLSAKIPAIIANSGENYLTTNLKENPYLFYNTLGLFQTAFMAGEYAVRTYGKNVTVVTSDYESGFDALHTFRLGVKYAGGNITKTHLKSPKDVNFISTVISRIGETRPDSVYSFLNGNLATDFMNQLNSVYPNIPVLTSDFTSEVGLSEKTSKSEVIAKSFISWTKYLENPENKQFVSDYIRNYSKSPDHFSMLGYESGLIIQNALEKTQDEVTGESLATALRKCDVVSPRGKLSINEKSGLVNHPVYLCEAQSSEFTVPQNIAIRDFSLIGEFDPVFASLETELRSGWITPYLFI